jgi:hypothetical protein
MILRPFDEPLEPPEAASGPQVEEPARGWPNGSGSNPSKYSGLSPEGTRRVRLGSLAQARKDSDLAAKAKSCPC